MSEIWQTTHHDAEDGFDVAPILLCLQAERRWHLSLDMAQAESALAQFRELAQHAVTDTMDEHEKMNTVVDAFYSTWLFSGSFKKSIEHKLNTVSYLLEYRTGGMIPLALLLSDLLVHVGLNAQPVMMDDDILVHICISEDEGYFIEPASGQQSWFLQPENDDTPLLDFQVLPNDELYKLFLTQQKWAFISKGQFGNALLCVELLMAEVGDDPYERRDRGYLLNQLDCPEMAKSDLEFFVSECPDDPAIELIQHQIDELTDKNKNNTLH